MNGDEEIKKNSSEDEAVSYLKNSNKIYYNLAHSMGEEIKEQPTLLEGGILKSYQLIGLQWLVSLYNNKLNGVLADEMGLGKTLQTISFLGYLRHIMGITGPHLITVPKSTLDNWKREFAKWTPEVNVLVLQGAKDERHALINERLIDEKFDVCITSYEMILREKAHLKKFAWEYIIIDEVKTTTVSAAATY